MELLGKMTYNLALSMGIIESVTKHIPILAGIQKARQQEQDKSSAAERFEERLRDEYDITFTAEKYPVWPNSQPAVESYAASLVMLDMLDTVFKRAKLQLSKEPSALDIGAGDWTYVHALRLFLQANSQSIHVHLEGVDILGKEHEASVNFRIKGIEGVRYLTDDFFNMPSTPDYDIIFAMHPLATKEVYDEWKIPYVPLNKFWKKAMEMLKPGGILFGCSYLFNEGASALNSFPEKERILEIHYYSPVKEIRGVDVSTIKGFDENAIMIARKPAETP